MRSGDGERGRPNRQAAGCDLELALWRAGYSAVAGVDEVGRGPLAGPVVAGAVILPPFFDGPWLPLVRDSKVLTPRRREQLACCIQRDALGCGIGVGPARLIDEIGLAAATRVAVDGALAMLSVTPDFLMLDAFLHRPSTVDQMALIGGDACCASIACASIVAKVARDRMLDGLDRRFPGYGLASHKGDGTQAHLQSLDVLGPCPVHRRSFAPVRARLNGASDVIPHVVSAADDEPDLPLATTEGLVPSHADD
ncbi:MAG: ribonuclease HII [Dehalococcoidia bacterium]